MRKEDTQWAEGVKDDFHSNRRGDLDNLTLAGVLSRRSARYRADVFYSLTSQRDFAGGRVDLVIVVALHFFLQDSPYVFQVGEFLQRTSSHDAVLQPAVGSFHFAFGLWREGIAHLDLQNRHDLAPLSNNILGFQDVLAPNTISLWHKTKDA